MSGLERSVSLLAKLIARLEANGVIVATFSPIDFFGKDVSNDDALLFESLIQWLLLEGIIRKNREPVGDGFGFIYTHHLVLTALGYRLLAGKHSANLSLSQTVAKINESGGSYSSLGDFVGSVLGGFTKSIGS